MTTFRAAQFAYFQRRNKVNKHFFVVVLLSAFEERKLENNIVDTLKPPVVSDDWPVDVCSTSGALEHVYTLCIRTCTFLFFFVVVLFQNKRIGADQMRRSTRMPRSHPQREQQQPTTTTEMMNAVR